LGVTEQGQPFYVMKFVRGRTLQQAIEEYHAGKPKGWDSQATGTAEVEQFRLLQVFLALCQTVAYAHSRGVLHRDLKPENVMLGPYGGAWQLGWGLAKVKGAPQAAPGEADASFVSPLESVQDTYTQAGAILGTPAYMAPETAAGLTAEFDERSDVFLLGA